MKLFSVHRHERMPAMLAALFILLLNTLNVLKYYDIFSVVADKYHDIFTDNFTVSGFDTFSYQTVSKWGVLYEVTRHPLMAFYMYVPAKINEALIAITGVNCATTIVAVLWSLCAFYAFIFLFRILHELQGLSVKSASMLCALFYGFGYTMLSIYVPDHFGPSVMLLLLTIYTVGRNTRDRKQTGIMQTLLLFFLTAGVSLSNGVKVFIATWINKGKGFFKPKYLLCAVVLPSLLIFGFARLEHIVFIQPGIEAVQQKKIAADKQWRTSIYKAYCDTAKNQDSAAVDAGVKKIIHDRVCAKFRADHRQPWNVHKGKTISKTGFLSWTDVSTPRWASLVENVFGEPVQIHEDYFLGDTLRTSRPVIVEYNHWYNYLAEGILLIMLLMGIWVGRHEKLIWTVISFFAFDMVLHLGLGFGLNEVYIMSPHYLFVIPIAIAPLFTSRKQWVKRTTMLSTVALTLWFFYWNLSLLLPFLTTKV